MFHTNDGCTHRFESNAGIPAYLCDCGVSGRALPPAPISNVD